ncbi:MAG TPA: phosphoribosylglycinamide formyltransferase [Candidatus Dormibacteraeota bacterium]|nr:phosphoribosylglycinamide formyltransferase [Candidatus Dormibacteraeota bacterium]
MKLGILVSGRGSNLDAVLSAVASGRLPKVEPVLVICNRPGVPALAVAARHGVPALVLRRADFADGAARDAAIGLALSDAGAELALLAGYDQRLHDAFFAAFPGQAINVHPSLLPRHGGTGMMGLAVHASVLASGDRVTGVTIHEVTSELDQGPPIAQVRVAVRAGESAETLAGRVLTIEHRAVVSVLARLAAERPGVDLSGSMTAARRARTARA